MRASKHITWALLLSFAVLVPAAAKAGCPAFPENEVWGKVSTSSVVRYVERAYGGDWGAYLEKWEKRARHARSLAGADSILVFHNTNTWLRGDALAAYAADVEGRMRVTRCLAGINADKPVSGETLAGSALNGGS